MIPPVSIVITCYNYGAFLGRAIESALGQTYSPCQVVVIDDGSTDRTVEVARSFEPRVEYIRQGNSGVASARNRGWRAGSGKFINFLDADDWLDPRKIEIQMTRFQANPELDVVTCGWFDADEEGTVLGEHRPVWEMHVLEHLLNNNSFVPCAALIRRPALERVRGFCEDKVSESWTEDTDLWLRLAATGSRFLMEPQALCYWRHHRSTTSRSENIGPSYIGFGKMIDRLEAMHSPLVSPERLRRFRALYHLSFCARFYARDQVGRAREIFEQAIQQFPDIVFTPRAFLELHTRTLSPSDASYPPKDAGVLERIEHILLEEMLPQLAQGMDDVTRRKLCAVACLYLADYAYGMDCAVKARQLTRRAIMYSPSILFLRSGIPTIARSLLGPATAGRLAQSARRVGTLRS